MSTTAETSRISGTTIRLASADDADAIFGLLEQLPSSYNPPRASFDEAFGDVVRDQEDRFLYVAEFGGSVVGYALTTVVRPLYTDGLSAELQELVVDVAARSRGIGSQLVTAVEAECRRRGARQLTVASSRGAAFYERLDYRSTADFLKKVLSD
ncbi:GNAT family N-acetyltransferase [Parafrigoribacterium soli]|uniref:GNAT family N-acetyltransferase n=1 Tax=Parafrigoribacterium soli TaxID=3144663 RepID=UPI0032EE2ECA